MNPNTPLYGYELSNVSGIQTMSINYLGALNVPSIAESADIMARVVDYLIEAPNTSRIVFVQQRNYCYNSEVVFLLQEVSNLYVYLTKQEKILSPFKLSISQSEYLSGRFNDVSYLIILLKRDPVMCYFELKRFIERERVNLENVPNELLLDFNNYLRLLEKFYLEVGDLKVIRDYKEYFENYIPGNRDIYFRMFRVEIMPNFTFTRLAAVVPEDAEIIDQYEIGQGYDSSVVTILKRIEDAKFTYHLMPPEYSLSDSMQDLLNQARNVLINQPPKAEEFTDPERTRQVFFNVSRDLIRDLAERKDIPENKKVKVDYNELNKLAAILVRYTIGFGLLEVLLQDKKIQDIVVNAPIAANPIFLRHQDYDECITNIRPSVEDGESWATKIRLISGRPLDEANPTLDYDLGLGNVRARVAVIQQPLSPEGLAYAIRRHRDDPWTLPLFIKNKMINSFSAGLMSFLVDGSRTLLVAGTRSSGKTSLLGALMLEIMPKYRIIVLEDTLELPVEAIRKLNYDILRMKVRSSLLKTSVEVGADEGIRTSLRLGDSSLIVGEVRSLEAQALYEAMRVGALANVVAGTIHGASPYGVFDRVVNDLKVPVTSFKATDCIIVANPVKSPDSLRTIKRVVQISEVRKQWTNDPLEENGFIDLMKYNVEKDELEQSEELINGDSEILKSIAVGVKGWAGNWDAVSDNILLRSKIKQELVDFSLKHDLPIILEAGFNSLSNNLFHQISRDVQEEVGLPVSDRVFLKWQDWLKKEVKARKII